MICQVMAIKNAQQKNAVTNTDVGNTIAGSLLLHLVDIIIYNVLCLCTAHLTKILNASYDKITTTPTAFKRQKIKNTSIKTTVKTVVTLC